MNYKNSSQTLKGILEGCILEIISRGEIYGYEMHDILVKNGFDMVAEGTIYPLLLKLQKQNLIEGIMRPSPDGPMRKYYHLTEQGILELELFKEHWVYLSNSVNKLLGGNKDEY